VSVSVIVIVSVVVVIVMIAVMMIVMIAVTMIVMIAVTMAVVSVGMAARMVPAMVRPHVRVMAPVAAVVPSSVGTIEAMVSPAMGVAPVGPGADA